MIHQLLFITILSLFDSLSTTTQIIVFALLLTTANPVKNALSFLAGLSGAYFICGVLGFAALNQVNAMLKTLMPSTANVPNFTYYQMELFMGAVLLISGPAYYYRKIKSNKPPVEHKIIEKFKRMNAWIAAGIGAFLSASSFPMALPYIVALNRFAALRLGAAQAAGCIAIYNVGYALPMVAIFAMYLFMEKGAERVEADLHERVRKLNLKLTAGILSGTGLLILADSCAYFFLGLPLMKGRYF